ncbi:hypothetical protein HDU77_001327 [Chytriomyces hyalinus]|nr:hypothetical protein HDU77_001327 [Chytriomyces hyalinus]
MQQTDPHQELQEGKKGGLTKEELNESSEFLDEKQLTVKAPKVMNSVETVSAYFSPKPSVEEFFVDSWKLEEYLTAAQAY